MRNHLAFTSFVFGVLSFLTIGCGTKQSANPPQNPPPPPQVGTPTPPNTVPPAQGNPTGQNNPGNAPLVPGGQLQPGSTLPGGQYVGNEGDGNYFCDDEWCYQYYGDNPGNGGTVKPGGTPAPSGNVGTGTPGYNDEDYYGDNSYNGNYGGSYYDTGDYYGNYTGANYGKAKAGSVDATGNYRGQWSTGWANDGWYHYGNDFYLDSRLNALQRSRTPGTAAKLKIRARARR